jgi:hypothetical protein
MNTFLRRSTIVSERMAICAHIEWLVSEIERVSMLVTERKTCEQQVLLELQIRKLLETISNLMCTYSNELIEPSCMEPSFTDVHRRLEMCMVRLLGSMTVIFSEDTHTTIDESPEVSV